MEGTSFGRDSNEFITESDIEDEMIKISKNTDGLVLVQQSSQNIDRLVSFYRAAIQSKRLFVIVFYSLWNGYLQEDSMKEMLGFIKDNKIEFHKLHTSGHASLKTLNKVVNRLKPDKVIPIHTFYPEKYLSLNANIVQASDGEIIDI